MKIILLKKTRIFQISVIVILVMFSILYSESINRNQILPTFLSTNKELPIYSVDTNEKKIAISFDAAWGSEKTDEILAILDHFKVKTTFFLVGFWVDKYPEKVKQIDIKGHEIGNHSTNHNHMSEMSVEQIQIDLRNTANKIMEITGKRVSLFRPPFGDYNDKLIETCREEKYNIIQWNVDSLDWKEYGVDHMVNQVMKYVKPGSIILFHNNSKYITQALPIILQELQQNNYKILPISELIYKDNYIIDHTGKQKRNVAD